MTHPRTVATPDDLPLMVLDVIRYDLERVGNIMQLINNDGCVGWRVLWPRDFTEDEVIAGLNFLLDQELVAVYRDKHELRELEPVAIADVDRSAIREYWFCPNERGWDAWDAWDPPIAEEDLDDSPA